MDVKSQPNSVTTADAPAGIEPRISRFAGGCVPWTRSGVGAAGLEPAPDGLGNRRTIRLC